MEIWGNYLPKIKFREVWFCNEKGGFTLLDTDYWRYSVTVEWLGYGFAWPYGEIYEQP